MSAPIFTNRKPDFGFAPKKVEPPKQTEVATIMEELFTPQADLPDLPPVPPRNFGKQPSRFFLKAAGPNVDSESSKSNLVIISSGLYEAWEHTLQDPQTMRYNIHEQCPQDKQVGCPLCMKGGAQHGAFFCAIEVKEFKYQDSFGNWKSTPHRLKTVVAKGKDVKFYEDLMEEYGTLRGICLTMERKSAQEPSIGVPTFDGFVDEDFLVEKFGSNEFVKNGEVVRPKNFFITAWDYYQDRNTVEQLNQKYGGEPPVGSMAWEAKQKQKQKEEDAKNAVLNDPSFEIPF